MMNESGPKSPENLERPTPRTNEYLASEHIKLMDCYTHCGVIADQVARLLIADGIMPQIEIVYEEVHLPRGQTIVKDFIPEQYRGKIEPWRGHFVCCTENLAFDPIIGYPVPKADYTMLAFGENIKMELRVPPDEIRRHLRIDE